MAITKAFTIAIPDQPYVDDFSGGKTQAATYNGPKFIKFQYHKDTGVISSVIGDGDTEDLMSQNELPCMEDHLSGYINAEENTLEAALITRSYDAGEVPNHTEDLGTTDADGNAETWEHEWNDGTGLLSQIYKLDTIKYQSNAVVMPEFRTHGLSREAFMEGVTGQIAGCDTELAKSDVYTDEEIASITAYKTFLESVSTKYADVDHWKIKFPQSPNFK